MQWWNMTFLFWTVGICVFSQTALAYPGGSVVSTGNNPIAAYGGEVVGGGSSATVTVLTASPDQDFVVTDVVLTPRFDSLGCRAVVAIDLSLSPGSSVAKYQMAWEIGYNSDTNHNPSQIDSHMVSGLRVPAGAALEISIQGRYRSGCGSWGVYYTLSGYHATP